MKKPYEPPHVEFIPVELDVSLIAASGPAINDSYSPSQQLSADVSIWPENPLKEGPWEEGE